MPTPPAVIIAPVVELVDCVLTNTFNPEELIYAILVKVELAGSIVAVLDTAKVIGTPDAVANKGLEPDFFTIPNLVLPLLAVSIPINALSAGSPALILLCTNRFPELFIYAAFSPSVLENMPNVSINPNPPVLWPTDHNAPVLSKV